MNKRIKVKVKHPEEKYFRAYVEKTCRFCITFKAKDINSVNECLNKMTDFELNDCMYDDDYDYDFNFVDIQEDDADFVGDNFIDLT